MGRDMAGQDVIVAAMPKTPSKDPAFAARLRELRAKKSAEEGRPISQEALARAANISVSGYKKMEQRGSAPTSALQKIADYHGLSIDCLLMRKPTLPTESDGDVKDSLGNSAPRSVSNNTEGGPEMPENTPEQQAIKALMALSPKVARAVIDVVESMINRKESEARKNPSERA